MEYTKGEWKVYKPSYKRGLLIMADEKQVAIIPPVTWLKAGEAQANAHLIASAPDLYEALKGYVMLCGNTAYQVDREGLQHYWQLAQQAFAKVEKA